jgi:hypothetical protein
VLNTLLTALGLLVFLGLGAFGVMSRREKERRAVRIAASMAVIWLMLMLFATTFSIAVKLALVLVIAAAGVATAILFVLPIGRVEGGDDVPSDRFDERDVVFARARLVPDSREFEAYYALRPGNRDVDEKIRALPGLLSLHAPKANPIAFASAKANFSLTEAMRAEVDGPVGSVRADLTASQSTSMVKQLALYYGAKVLPCLFAHRSWNGCVW